MAPHAAYFRETASAKEWDSVLRYHVHVFSKMLVSILALWLQPFLLRYKVSLAGADCSVKELKLISLEEGTRNRGKWWLNSNCRILELYFCSSSFRDEEQKRQVMKCVEGWDAAIPPVFEYIRININRNQDSISNELPKTMTIIFIID